MKRSDSKQKLAYKKEAVDDKSQTKAFSKPKFADKPLSSASHQRPPINNTTKPPKSVSKFTEDTSRNQPLVSSNQPQRSVLDDIQIEEMKKDKNDGTLMTPIDLKEDIESHYSDTEDAKVDTDANASNQPDLTTNTNDAGETGTTQDKYDTDEPLVQDNSQT